MTFIKNGIVNTVSNLTSGAKNVATQAFNTIKNTDWAGLGKTVLTNVKNGIVNTVGTLTSGAKNVASQAINTIKNSSWYSAGSSALTTIKNGLSGTVSTLTNAAKSVATQALNAFKNTSFYSVGSNIISGIKNGISNAASSLYQSLRNLAANALAAAKRALGIHSPSRVFRDEIGAMMAQGISVGFDDEMENVDKDIQDSLDTEFSVNPKLNANIADKKAIAGLTGGSSFNIDLGDIIVQGNADEVTLAKVEAISTQKVKDFDKAISPYLYSLAGVTTLPQTA